MQSVLSRRVIGKVSLSEREPVVAIQPRGSGIPLFLVAPGVESISFTRRLGLDQPIFGIRVPPAGNDPNSRDIEDLAAQCAREILRICPSGPYAFAGWCNAGLLGLEIGRHLERMGQRVVFAALFDARTLFIPPMSRSRRVLVRCWHQVQRLGFFVSRVREQGFGPIRRAIGDRSNSLQEASGRILGNGSADQIGNGLRRYHPTAWTGRVVHIWAEKRPKGRFRDPEFLWSATSPQGFKFYEVPGDHHTMLQEPNVGRVAALLGRELRRARLTPGIQRTPELSRSERT